MKMKNDAAISGAIAGAGKMMGDWMKAKGVEPSLKSGTPQSSKIGINVEKINGQWYKVGIDGTLTKTNPFLAYTVGSANPIFQQLNRLPGSPPFASFHDSLRVPNTLLLNQISIAPTYALTQCAAMPNVCAMFPGMFVEIGTGGLVKTDIDINKQDNLYS